jgi:hypothetical protein
LLGGVHPINAWGESMDEVEHERQSNAGSHAFDPACYYCLRDFYEEALANPVAPLDVEWLATAIAIAESQAPDDANDEERREWRDKAETVAATYDRLRAAHPDTAGEPG